MKVTRTHQWTSLLLSGALVAGMMITPSLAAGGAELEFQYPSDVKAEDVCSATRFLRNSDRIIEKK